MPEHAAWTLAGCILMLLRTTFGDDSPTPQSTGRMSTSATAVLLSLVLVAPLAAQQDAPTIIRDVAVIDVLDGSVIEHRSVVIHDGRIAAIGPAAEVIAPAGAEVVDGSGKYLIPGLWDMHTHLLWSTDATEHAFTEMPRDVDGWTLWERYYGPTLDLMVANGVTGIRDMTGSLEIVRRVRGEAAAGERLAPRMSVAGHVMDGAPAPWPGMVVVMTPGEARDAVDSLHAAGAEFIKVRNRIRPDVYHAILERAQDLGLAVVGHVPWLVRAAEASDAGQGTIEHVTGIVEGCSVALDELIELNHRILEALTAGDRNALDSLEDRSFPRMLSTQDPDRCRTLLRRLAQNGTWLVPTLVNALGLRAQVSEASEGHEPLLRYIHPGWLESWTPEHSPYGEKTDRGYLQRQRIHERMAEITGMAAEEGVGILSGSDTPNAYVFPGFALHEELELLVDAGLTPLQALQAATVNPARFLNATDSLGTVEEGKVADLVLLDANPLEDIRHIRRIDAVVLDGHLLRRDSLDRLLEEVERAFASGQPDRP